MPAWVLRAFPSEPRRLPAWIELRADVESKAGRGPPVLRGTLRGGAATQIADQGNCGELSVPRVNVEYGAAVGQWTLPRRPRAGGQVASQAIRLPEQQCPFHVGNNDEVADTFHGVFTSPFVEERVPEFAYQIGDQLSRPETLHEFVTGAVTARFARSDVLDLDEKRLLGSLDNPVDRMHLRYATRLVVELASMDAIRKRKGQLSFTKYRHRS